jgi:hypothetical protein
VTPDANQDFYCTIGRNSRSDGNGPRVTPNSFSAVTAQQTKF